MRKSLPRGWVSAPLGNVVRIITRSAVPVLPGHAPVAYVRPDQISSRRGTIERSEQRLFGDVRKDYAFFQEGDILFPKFQGWIKEGKVALSRGLGSDTGCTSPEFYVLRPVDPAVTLPAWLWYFLRHPSVLESAAASAMGSSGRMRMPSDFLRTLEVPVPPQQEQERLTAILQETEALRRLRDDADSRWEQLLRSLFKQWCGDPAELWDSPVHLGDIATISVGGTPPRSRPELFGDAIPWVKSGELADQDVWDTEQMIASEAVGEFRAPILRPGTILLGMYGASAGRTGRLLRSATTNQAIAGITSVHDDFPDDFIWAWLQVSRNQVRDLRRGITLQNLNSRIVHEIPVPLVSAEARDRLLAAVSEIQTARAAAVTQGQHLDLLFTAILQLVFGGILSQDEAGATPPRIAPLMDAENVKTNLMRAARQRTVWKALSPTQQNVWEACVPLDRPFTVYDVENQLRDMRKPVPERENLRGAIELLVLLGAVIRDSRSEAGVWRRPNPDFDREVVV